MKRYRLLAILCIVFMITALSQPIISAEDVAIVAEIQDNPTLIAGKEQTVTVTLSIKGSATFRTLCFEPHAWPSGISMISAKYGNDDMTLENSVYKWVADSNITAVDKILVTLQLTLSADLAAGSYDINFSYVSLTNKAGNEVINTPVKCSLSLLSASGGYIASLNGGDTILENETIDLTVTASHTADTVYAAAQLELSYDAALLSFVSVSGGTTNTNPNGTLKIADYGTNKALPQTYTIRFKALTAGTAVVTLTSAAFSKQENAVEKDLDAAIIKVSSVSVVICREYDVTLPDIFTGNSKVIEGSTYTFTATDADHYSYAQPTATMGGNPVTVSGSAESGYSIENVTGALVITGSRTAKTYAIQFTTSTDVSPLPENCPAAAYGTDFKFTLPTEEHYAVSLTSVLYANQETVPYSLADGVVTISGTDILQDITVTIDKVLADAVVSVEGNAASAAQGYTAFAVPGTDYTLTIQTDDRYTYTVTASVNGTAVTLTESGSQYTITGTDITAGQITFQVNRVLKITDAAVTKYLELTGKALWLIACPAEKPDEEIYTYQNASMFWSKDKEAFVILIEAASQTQISLNASDFAIISGTPTTLSGMDVNQSGRLDANDAQLVYDIYNNVYPSLNGTVSMAKFLLADVNLDNTVTVEDAAAIISEILS